MFLKGPHFLLLGGRSRPATECSGAQRKAYFLETWDTSDEQLWQMNLANILRSALQSQRLPSSLSSSLLPFTGWELHSTLMLASHHPGSLSMVLCEHVPLVSLMSPRLPPCLPPREHRRTSIIANASFGDKTNRQEKVPLNCVVQIPATSNKH